MSYSEFAQKWGRDPRYKILEKNRDREAYFLEYQAELRRKEKESRSHKKDKVRHIFTFRFIMIILLSLFS
jgi:transcription elongation regulator 1